MSNKQIEEFIIKVLTETKKDCYLKIGKNYYITSEKYKVRITVNSNTYRIITADNINK